MQSSIQIVKRADDISLISLYEAKIALQITDDTQDELLERLILQMSGEIAALCNRTFARETLIETFREINENIARLYLSHWPVKEITLVTNNGAELVADVDYELDSETGRLWNISGTWDEPVVVAYTGGYLLPFEAPYALRQASILLSREAYFAATRGDASVRMISHKDSRIIYFDPNARTAVASGAAGSAAQRAAGDLLKRFTRFEV